jgi:hypothetical protein
MDIDNFEFRPLTQGLGFDKTTEESRKNKSSQKRVSTTETQAKINSHNPIEKEDFEIPNLDFEFPNQAPVSRSLKKMLDSLPPSVDYTVDKSRELHMRAPLTKIKQETPTYTMPAIDSKQFDVTLNNSLSQAFPKEEVNKRFYHQLVTPVPQFKEMNSSFASAIIDAMIILGVGSLFVVSLVAFTGTDLFAMLSNRSLSMQTSLELAAIYFLVTLVYFMLTRGFYGSTLGDWAFDVQLGSENEREHFMYPFQVMFRSFIMIVTGIIIIPVLSLAFGKDMAYYFSGLKLYSRQF